MDACDDEHDVCGGEEEEEVDRKEDAKDEYVEEARKGPRETTVAACTEPASGEGDGAQGGGEAHRCIGLGKLVGSASRRRYWRMCLKLASVMKRPKLRGGNKGVTSCFAKYIGRFGKGRMLIAYSMPTNRRMDSVVTFNLPSGVTLFVACTMMGRMSRGKDKKK
jgi:hypothetical protein